MALSTGISFYQFYPYSRHLRFERRDFVLLAGIILLILGLSPFILLAYATIIGGISFFGIKFFVNKRKKQMTAQFGEGFCVECGEKIVNKKCPNCDNASKTKV